MSSINIDEKDQRMTPTDQSQETLDDPNLKMSDNVPPVVVKESETQAEPEASRTKLQTVIIMLSLCSSVFLAALDMTIVATAVPTISAHVRHFIVAP